jgi:hypothetical protein
MEYLGQRQLRRIQAVLAVVTHSVMVRVEASQYRGVRDQSDRCRSDGIVETYPLPGEPV